MLFRSQDERPLQTAVRNAVIEVRRLSERGQWFHVESSQNVADLATRRATVDDIQPGSDWQCGKDWMCQERENMPVKTAEQITLSAEEKRLAAAEMRAKDIYGHAINLVIDKMAARYASSAYVLDPAEVAESEM